MIRGLSVIEGLGGTGKTHAILDAARHIARDGDDSVYLCFNRPLRESTGGKLSGSRTEAFTIHGFCFRALAELGRLPRELDGVGGEDEISRKKAFEKLLAAFHTTFVDEGVKVPARLRRYRHVFIDEYQNLDDDLLRTVSDIATLLDAELHLTGDPLQVGYGFQEKHRARSGNFERIKEIFGRAADEKVELTENHRSRTAIVSFIDGYLERAFEGKRTCDTDGGTTPSTKSRGTGPGSRSSDGRKTRRHMLSLRSKIRAADKGASIAILSRYDRDLEVYRRAKIEGPRVAISTIHSSIGREAEHVFLVAFQDPLAARGTTRERSTRRGASSTRPSSGRGRASASRRRILTSTRIGGSTRRPAISPSTTIERSKPYGRFPKIRENANYSRRKYDLASIDSIP